MNWTAPDVDRQREPYVADERAMLEGWLDYHRQTLLLKCAGLDAELLRLRSVEPSALTLLGLVRHMTDVERWWFRQCAAGEQVADLYVAAGRPDADFEDLGSTPPEAGLTAFTAECAAADSAVADRPLDATFAHPHAATEFSLRWVYVHMIEEYARHNGHADLLRERIDGVTGV